MICYLRSSAASYDIRLKKYLLACQSANIDYLAITWDRLLSGKRMHREISFPQKASYGHNNRFIKFIYLICWLLFVCFHLWKNRKEYHVIHACNNETAPVAYLFKLILKKKFVFDLYDSSGRKAYERFFATHCDALILPHKKRIEQLNVNIQEIKHFIIIENVPVISNDFDLHHGLKEPDKIRLSYVGTFQKNIRGIENVIKLVLEDERFIFEVAGTGDNMEDLFKELSSKCDRIIYHGAVSYDIGLNIMRNSDFIMGLYYLINPTHKYASPNKFYESLYLSVPIITSEQTLVGDHVKQINSGYCIKDSYEALQNFFCNINDKFIKEYHQKEMAAYNTWNNNYRTYFTTYCIDNYFNILKKL